MKSISKCLLAVGAVVALMAFTSSAFATTTGKYGLEWEGKPLPVGSQKVELRSQGQNEIWFDKWGHVRCQSQLFSRNVLMNKEVSGTNQSFELGESGPQEITGCQNPSGGIVTFSQVTLGNLTGGGGSIHASLSFKITLSSGTTCLYSGALHGSYNPEVRPSTITFSQNLLSEVRPAACGAAYFNGSYNVVYQAKPVVLN